MDLTLYRSSDPEKARTADLLRLMPLMADHALDVGARDGHFSVLMAERFARVTALDLTLPKVSHPKVACVAGSATQLQFPDRSFDFVFCAEVLEHIPEPDLTAACRELSRVSSKHILIGVPNEQDIRVGRTTCRSCGKPNPPWGHVNAFDLDRLRHLFPDHEVELKSFVGERHEATNGISVALMDFAGNPYGTYDQEEHCIHCGSALQSPPRRSVSQLAATKLAFWLRGATEALSKPRPNWIHLLLCRRGDA